MYLPGGPPGDGQTCSEVTVDNLPGAHLNDCTQGPRLQDGNSGQPANASFTSAQTRDWWLGWQGGLGTNSRNIRPNRVQGQGQVLGCPEHLVEVYRKTFGIRNGIEAGLWKGGAHSGGRNSLEGVKGQQSSGPLEFPITIAWRNRLVLIIRDAVATTVCDSLINILATWCY